jgi:hypothetical protein
MASGFFKPYLALNPAAFFEISILISKIPMVGELQIKIYCWLSSM